MTKHDAATGNRDRISLHVTSGSRNDGRPLATGPITAMLCSEKCHKALAAIVPATASSDRGQRGR